MSEKCEHDECYWATDDSVPGDAGTCCDCGAARRPAEDEVDRG